MRRPLTGRCAVALMVTATVMGTAACGGRAESSEPTATATTVLAPVEEPAGGAYLALGDSVPFGFRGGAVAEYPNADNFVGYPELVGQDLGLDVINASCPGETTASFLDVAAQSNGCHNSLNSSYGYGNAYPLHVPYDSTDQSQMDFAVRALTETEDVDLVTLQIGANDGFICQLTTASRCLSPEDVAMLAQSVQGNLQTILSRLRTEGNYEGQIVVVTYYALNYNDPVAGTIAALDTAIAQTAAANGATLADGYQAFKQRTAETGGDSIAAGLVLPNDVHPSAEGQRVLADAVTAVVGN